MLELANIVVGTDFNELATDALRAAARIASRSGARLTVVYADRFDPPSEFTAVQLPQLTHDLASARQHAIEALRQYVAKHAPSVAVEPVVVEAAPADAILRTAERTGADLIVLGTHGRGGLLRMLIGSVAETVLRHATAPVLTMRACAEAGSAISRIVCPIDISQEAAAAVEYAASLAALLGAELTVLHVATAAESVENVSAVVRGLLPANAGDVAISAEVIHGNPADEIVQFAHRRSAQLIVVGTDGKKGAFGSTVTRIVRQAPCGVITVGLRRKRDRLGPGLTHTAAR